MDQKPVNVSNTRYSEVPTKMCLKHTANTFLQDTVQYYVPDIYFSLISLKNTVSLKRAAFDEAIL